MIINKNTTKRSQATSTAFCQLMAWQEAYFLPFPGTLPPAFTALRHQRKPHILQFSPKNVHKKSIPESCLLPGMLFFIL